MLLDTLSVEVEVNANADYFVVVKNADVLADVLLGFSDQSHLLFGKLDNFFVACAVFLAEFASFFPLGAESTSATATELSTSTSSSERSITILARSALVGTFAALNDVAFGVALLVCAVSTTATELAIATTTPLAAASEFTTTSLGEVFAFFLNVRVRLGLFGC
jgi:uncharacterized membrane protein